MVASRQDHTNASHRYLERVDTHAADRNHATVANGFIALGARAVLASVFPLFAPTAATFAARLIYRLADFLTPAIRLFDRALTWTEVVSGMIRMQLLTDFLRKLELGNQITKETYVSIHQAGNVAINGGVPIHLASWSIPLLMRDLSVLQRFVSWSSPSLTLVRSATCMWDVQRQSD